VGYLPTNLEINYREITKTPLFIAIWRKRYHEKVESKL